MPVFRKKLELTWTLTAAPVLSKFIQHSWIVQMNDTARFLFLSPKALSPEDFVPNHFTLNNTLVYPPAIMQKNTKPKTVPTSTLGSLTHKIFFRQGTHVYMALFFSYARFLGLSSQAHSWSKCIFGWSFSTGSHHGQPSLLHFTFAEPNAWTHSRVQRLAETTTVAYWSWTSMVALFSPTGRPDPIFFHLNAKLNVWLG